jgi:hypothetical protein
MTSKRILLPHFFDILPGLPEGLSRSDASDYILSQTFARTLGDNVPRRDVLLKLAGTLALAALPVRPAHAVPLVVVGIAAVALAAETFRVFRATAGTFEASNESRTQKQGYVMINCYDVRRDLVESSITARYSFPPDTTATLNFRNGPAATTKGHKRCEVVAEDSSDDDEFEAV